MSLQIFISYLLVFLGVFFWLWGTIPILNKKNSLLYKLHTLTVADTVGSGLILISLIIRNPNYWPILSISIVTLTLWNTIFGYLLGNLTDN
tara:strand:- start:860 stop:1132 length:273 start_codon:yes stop_codon:yes gene_type:complete